MKTRERGTIPKYTGQSPAEKRWRADQRRWVDSFCRDMRGRGLIQDTDTALFTRSLAQILARPFDRRYVALMAESMMERGEPVDMAAASVMSRGHEVFGEATLTATYETEIATVEVQGQEHPQPIYGVLTKFNLGYQQIRQAAYSRVPLPAMLGDGANRVVATTVDQVLSTGNASAGITGMINNALVPVVQGAVTLIPVATTGLWAAAATTNANIVTDFSLCIAWLERTSLYKVTHVAVAPLEWGRLITPDTAAGYAPNLKTVLENTFGITIVPWPRLTGQSATGPAGTNRAIFYEKSLDVFSPMVSAGPEQFPPVPTDTGYSITLHRRVGGVESMHPLGALYFDMA